MKMCLRQNLSFLSNISTNFRIFLPASLFLASKVLIICNDVTNNYYSYGEYFFDTMNILSIAERATRMYWHTLEALHIGYSTYFQGY